MPEISAQPNRGKMRLPYFLAGIPIAATLIAPFFLNRAFPFILDSIAAHGRDLYLEMGEGPATLMVNMAHSALTELSSRRYVFGIGRRRR